MRGGFCGLLLCLRGSVCLYQGEELGLTEAYVAYEDLQDPYGIRFWPNYKGRDGCRTPIPWISDNQNGGFSDAKPWLPMAVEHLHRAVATRRPRKTARWPSTAR
jgi:alpha-glucosidase